MTTESNDNDPRVSEAYRSFSTETTPKELDREILSMAAGSSRSRYGLARAWIRPVAWAATIGLSLAFVLEMTQVRDAQAPYSNADVAEPLEERIANDPAPAPAQISVPAAKQASSPPAATEPMPQAEAELPMGRASVSEDFEADEMTMLRDADEQARARSGSEQASTAANLTFDAAMTLEKKEKIDHCDTDVRSSAETWHACVVELRDQGLSDAADEELQSLLAEFPGFEVPDPSR